MADGVKTIQQQLDALEADKTAQQRQIDAQQERQDKQDERHDAQQRRQDKQQRLIDAFKAVLGAQDAQPTWMAHVGGALIILSMVIFILQYNLWYCLWFFGGGDNSDAHGHRSKRCAACIDIMYVGGALNAAAVACYVHYTLERTDMLAWGSGYFALMAAVGAVGAAAQIAQLRAGKDWEAARNAFTAKMFRAFGVTVDKLADVDKHGTPLYLLVGLVPAIVTGFLVRWFIVPRYVTDCSARWTNSTAGISACIVADGVCCKVLDQRFESFEYFTFVGFLTGNVIAAYKGVQFGAMCLLAKAKADGAVEGGAQGGRKFSLASGRTRSTSGMSLNQGAPEDGGSAL